jgi:Bacterial low temperature requirement A protein (LtrA)
MESRIGPNARRLLIALAAMVGVFAIGLLASRAAFAKDGDVIKRAGCSGWNTAKLKLSHEDGRIEVELEVDQNRNDVRWRIRIHRPGGRQIFAGTRVTRPPSRSFELRRLTAVSPSEQVCPSSEVTQRRARQSSSFSSTPRESVSDRRVTQWATWGALRHDLVWELAAGSLWVAGALADGDVRLALWAAAVAVTYAGVAVLHWLPARGRAIDLAHSNIAGGHLVERFRLFFIIVLGETVILMGDAFTGEPFEIERLLALTVAFTGTVALWWCYFQRVERIGAAAVEDAETAGAVGVRGTWTLTLIVIAVIGIAVGDELAIAHPGDEPTLGFTILTFGGPALFLVAQILFLRVTTGKLSHSRILALAALPVLALATFQSSLIAGIAATTVVLAVAIGDTVPSGNAGIRQLLHTQAPRGSRTCAPQRCDGNGFVLSVRARWIAFWAARRVVRAVFSGIWSRSM